MRVFAALHANIWMFVFRMSSTRLNCQDVLRSMERMQNVSSLALVYCIPINTMVASCTRETVQHERRQKGGCQTISLWLSELVRCTSIQLQRSWHRLWEMHCLQTIWFALCLHVDCRTLLNSFAPFSGSNIQGEADALQVTSAAGAFWIKASASMIRRFKEPLQNRELKDWHFILIYFVCFNILKSLCCAWVLLR